MNSRRVRLILVSLCLHFGLSAWAVKPGADEQTLRAINKNGTSDSEKFEVSAGDKSCRATYDSCGQTCNGNDYATCLDACLRSYQTCSGALATEAPATGTAGPYDRAVKACQSYRKASLGVEVARQQAQAILTEIMRLNSTGDPNDKSLAIGMIGDSDAEYVQAAKDAVTAEANHALQLLLTKDPANPGQPIGAARNVATLEPPSAKFHCDLVSPPSETPNDLSNALSASGVDIDKFDELMAAGKMNEAVGMVHDHLLISNPTVVPSPETIARAEALKQKIIDEADIPDLDFNPKTHIARAKPVPKEN